MNDSPGDLRVSLRRLFRRPAYLIASALTLALGIGATTAVFSLATGILRSALPYPDADRLVAITEASTQGAPRPLSYPTFEDWQSESGDVFENLAYAYGMAPALRTDEGLVRVTTAYVTDEFFETLGTPAQFGRTFADGDVSGGFPIVVSHDFWMRRLGGQPDVTNQYLTLGGTAFRVVGVMPREFAFPAWAETWTVEQALPPAGRLAWQARSGTVAYAEHPANAASNQTV